MAIFDDIAESYDSWYQEKIGSFADKVETELAFRLFKPEKGMKVLDVGCGTGNFSIKLARLGCDVTGIDISERMLQLARRKSKQQGFNITFRNMDVCDLNFPDESFDAVFSMATIEFVAEPEKAVNEMFRVAKKGAQILIGTIQRNSRWGRLYMSEDFQKNTVFKHARFLTLEELTSLWRNNLVSSGECLFIPPDATPEDFSAENEEKMSRSEKGGYICALWRK